jgi:PAS domain S-box-containing protein
VGDGRKQIDGPSGARSEGGASGGLREAALTALDSMVAMAVIDAEGKLVHVSRRWCEVTGLAAADILGEHWAKVVHPEDLPDALAVGRDVVQEGAGITYESRIATREGRVMWVESKISPLYDEDGNLRSWLLVTTDLTAHKEATEALRQSERRLQVIFDNSTDIITVLDEDGVARSTSSGGYRQLGYLEPPILEDDPGLVPEERAVLEAVVERL